MALRVLIVDDHQLFAEALRAILDTEAAMDVVGLATTGAEGVRKAVELSPDVVLMDISMPGIDGHEAARQIVEQHPGTRVLMVTGSDDLRDVDAARAAGASGYVTKDRIAAELVDAILDGAGPWPLP